MNLPPSHGKLIVFDGIDGSGKSTQVSLLTKALQQRNLPVIASSEPTKGPWGMQLRKTASSQRLSAQEELDLLLADRREHVKNLIGPALQKGMWVILDRYYFSTIAYQGSRGIDPQSIRQLNEDFAPIPDVLFLMKITTQTALHRIAQRDIAGPNAFEKQESLDACQTLFHTFNHETFTQQLDSEHLQADQLHRIVLKKLHIL